MARAQLEQGEEETRLSERLETLTSATRGTRTAVDMTASQVRSQVDAAEKSKRELSEQIAQVRRLVHATDARKDLEHEGKKTVSSMKALLRDHATTIEREHKNIVSQMNALVAPLQPLVDHVSDLKGYVAHAFFQMEERMKNSEAEQARLVQFRAKQATLLERIEGKLNSIVNSAVKTSPVIRPRSKLDYTRADSLYNNRSAPEPRIHSRIRNPRVTSSLGASSSYVEKRNVMLPRPPVQNCTETLSSQSTRGQSEPEEYVRDAGPSSTKRRKAAKNKMNVISLLSSQSADISSSTKQGTARANSVGDSLFTEVGTTPRLPITRSSSSSKVKNESSDGYWSIGSRIRSRKRRKP